MSERARRNSLGRGLAALFGEAETEGAGAPGSSPGPAPRLVAIELLRPSPLQPRRHFPEDEIEGLAKSIREKGILQPLLVRPLAEAHGEFELVAGERRWRAAQRVGLSEVPVVVRPLADFEALEIALVENLQREDLSPLEEAEAYSRLVKDFGRTQANLAEALGKSRSHIANTLRLLSLPPAVRRHLEEGRLSAGHARALLGAADPASLAEEVVRRALNVRATEKLAQRAVLSTSKGRASPTAPRRHQRDADATALERELSSLLGLRVTLTPRARGGSLTLHYSTLDQLDDLLRRLRRS